MPRLPISGFIELENGLVIPWLRFAESEEEAIRIARAQHANVRRCWVP